MLQGLCWLPYCSLITRRGCTWEEQMTEDLLVHDDSHNSIEPHRDIEPHHNSIEPHHDSIEPPQIVSDESRAGSPLHPPP